MSPSPAPARPICEHDPDKWFDRHQRRDALAACLACPARKWCAAQAISHRASWGMWAGIWIDGRFDEVAHYLRAIASGPATTHSRRTAIPAVPAALQPPPSALPDPPTADDAGALPAAFLRRPPADPPSVPAAVTARSSGHCEVMAPGCRLTSSKIVSRVPDLAVRAGDPSLAFCICAACETTLSDLDRHIARRLGYRLPSPRAAAAAFYWRQFCWVVLDEAGGLRAAAAAA